MKKVITLENGRRKVYTDFSDAKDRTDQQFKDQCDLNKLIKKYTPQQVNTIMRQGGPVQSLNGGTYSDISNLPNFQEALNITIKAQNDFLALPSNIRKRFENDPQQLITFLQDKKNHEEALKLGLITNKPTDTNTQILNEIKKQNAKNDQTMNAKTKKPSDDQSQ